MTSMNIIQPKIVRTWFDTVLNPMIKGLENEKYFLENNNLTWRSYNNRFEFLKPILTFFDFQYYANYEQFLDNYEEIQQLIDKHDYNLTKLIESCYFLSNELIKSESLRSIYYNELENLKITNSKLEEYELNGLENEKNLQFIVEYIINDKEELESSYTLSPIWNAQMKNFKNILNEKQIKNSVVDKNNFLEIFKKTVISTLSEFKKIRNNLSLNSGEPIVMFTNKNYEN
jgi:hypothetical protein